MRESGNIFRAICRLSALMQPSEMCARRSRAFLRGMRVAYTNAGIVERRGCAGERGRTRCIRADTEVFAFLGSVKRRYTPGLLRLPDSTNTALRALLLYKFTEDISRVKTSVNIDEQSNV